MSFITAIGVANPPHKFSQASIAEFMIRAMQLEPEKARKLKALYRATGIESRYSVISDYGKEKNFEFYSDSKSFDPLPTTKDRLELFRKHAVTLGTHAAESCLEKVHRIHRHEFSHLIVVSCTGMYAPGLDIDLIKSLRLRNDIQRTCINFMGCYAAFNALKLATTCCEHNPSAKVLVVCVELCSIHFQKENTTDNILANALFGDGAAALVVEGKPGRGLNLKPETFHCEIASDGENEMAWTIGDLGFEMKLSTYVPDIIQKGIAGLTGRLLENISLTAEQIEYYAIHPGGRKILEVIERELNIDAKKNSAAYTVLQQYGNMSSPTVLFVLYELCHELRSTDHNKNILSFAFGPGLTLESMILKIVMT